MTTEYRFDNSALKQRVQTLVDNAEFTEFDDLREYPPVMDVGAVFYPSDAAFADAVKKKLGKNPVEIKKCPDWARCLSGKDGLAVEFVILVDEAVLAGYSENAQDGCFHRVLSFLSIQGKVDPESGSWSVKTENGRPIYKIERPEVQSKDTLRRYGAIDPDTAAMVMAIEASKGQGMMNFQEPQIPDDLE